MNNQKPEIKLEVTRLYNSFKKSIMDDVRKLEADGKTQSSRYRQSIVVLDEECIEQLREQNFPIWEVYSEALEMVFKDLKDGYGPRTISIPAFDHQGRDWVVGEIEKLVNGAHKWNAQLKENSEVMAVFMLGFGSLRGEPTKDTPIVDGVPVSETGLLPVACAQLTDYTDDEGVVLDYLPWSLQTHGVFTDPNVLKQFGRLDSEDE